MIDMILVVVTILMNMVSMLDIWMILYLLFGCDMKVNFRNMAVAASIFLVADFLCEWLIPNENILVTAMIFGYNLLVTFILTRSHKMKALFLSIPALLVYIQFGNIIYLIEKITGLDRYYVMDSGGNKFLMFDITSDILLLGILVLLGRTKIAKTKHIQLTVGEGIGLTALCIFSPFIIAAMDWFHKQEAAPFYYWLWMVFVLVMNGAVVYAIMHRKTATYYRELSENYKKEFESQYSFFKDYKKRQKDTIKFRHDWKNHILLLQEMLDKKEYKKAESYFKELTNSASDSVYKITTGNDLVDMILSTKMALFEENAITVICEGNFAELTFMDQVDCCILLSNLLDNAIEANRKVKENRYLTLTFKTMENLCYLDISNPMTGILKQTSDRIGTTKEDKGNHGIGLQNVRDIVKKYHGSCQITAENGVFVISMIFCRKERDTETGDGK